MLTTETTSPQMSRSHIRIGLLLVPFGLFLILRGLYDIVTNTIGMAFSIVYLLVCLVVIVGTFVVPTRIRAYYDRLLGPENRPDVQKPDSGWLGFVALIVIVVLLAGSREVEQLTTQLSVDVFIALVGCLVGGFGLVIGWRWHFVAVGGLVVLFSFLPLTGLVSMAAFSDTGIPIGAIRSAMPGIALVALGLIDHILLVRQARAWATP